MIVVDTGPLVALANERDHDHPACRALLSGFTAPLLVPSPVLTEVCYLLEKRRGPQLEAAFLDDLAEGVLQLVALERTSRLRWCSRIALSSSSSIGTSASRRILWLK